jgi:hypothetical protein
MQKLDQRLIEASDSRPRLPRILVMRAPGNEQIDTARLHAKRKALRGNMLAIAGGRANASANDSVRLPLLAKKQECMQELGRTFAETGTAISHLSPPAPEDMPDSSSSWGVSGAKAYVCGVLARFLTTLSRRQESGTYTGPLHGPV